MKINKIPFALCGLLFVQTTVLAEPKPKPEPDLPAYGADKTQVSVSGLSSGAFMTAQLHVAYSEQLMGAGILAGGTYYCAGYENLGKDRLNIGITNTQGSATHPCMQTSLPRPGKDFYQEAERFAEKGLIDNLEHLKNDKLYIFAGTKDSTVEPTVVNQAFEFYKAAGIPSDNIKFHNNFPAGHAILTKNGFDTQCDETKPPYINNCGIFQSHELLETIYNNLEEPEKYPSGKVITFNQKEFMQPDKPDLSSMSPIGFAYIPESCETTSCRVHIAFHGCKQGYTEIGTDYINNTGYNEMAAANNIIVLYPQVEKSTQAPVNPEGCWDFWGYSQPEKPLNFYTKQAPQMQAVMGMVKRLTNPRTTTITQNFK